MRNRKDFFHPKRAECIAKQVVFREKVHVFLCAFRKCGIIVRFSLRKMRDFERKSLLLPLIKHNLSFFPPHCGVPIAQILQALPRASAQTIFDMLNIASLVPGLLESQGKARGLGTLLYVAAPIVPPKNTPSLRQGGARGFVEKGRRCEPDQYLCSLSANSLCVRLLRSMLYQA